MPKRAVPFIAAVALVVVISVLAYSGYIPSMVSRLGLDKVLHAAMGCALTVLLARALRGRAVLAGVLVMLPLATDEYLDRLRNPVNINDMPIIASRGLAIIVLKNSARQNNITMAGTIG